MNLLLLNRDFALPADGWSHIVPQGEFPHPSGITQVIDDSACAAMLADYKHRASAPNFPGLLVDFDHFSSDTSQASAAAGWITDLRNRADGLWASIRCSARFYSLGMASIKHSSRNARPMSSNLSPLFRKSSAAGGW